MSRRFRRFLFYFFVLMFFLTAPFIVLYANGYKYDYEQNKFIETGAIYIKSHPKKAKIFINNKIVNKTTPILIKGLLPHRYSIKITIDETQEWNKDLEVYPGLVTKAENVMLFPSHPETTLLNEQKINNFYLSPDKERALLVQEDGIWVQELKKNSAAIQLINNESKSYQDIQWSENSKYFIFNSASQWFLVDIQKPSDQLNITEKLGSDISNLKWSTKNSEHIYFLGNAGLSRFEWRSKNIALMAENIHNYFVFHNALYVIANPNKFIYRLNLDGQNRTQLIFNYPENITIERLQVSNNETMMIFDTNQKIYIAKDGLLAPIVDNVKSIEFSKDNKKLLVHTPNEIFVHYLDDVEGAPNRKRGEQILLTRNSELIQKAFFVPFDYEHVIFEVNGVIKIAEIDNRDNLNIADLTAGQNFDIIFDNNILNIYYTDDKGLNLIEIEV